MACRSDWAIRRHLTFCGPLAIACAVAWNAPTNAQPTPPLLEIPRVECQVTIDGHLDEACYRRAVHVTAFVVASRPSERAPRTDASIFWNPGQLVFAFDVDDSTVHAEPPTSDEREVDRQDRVEVFLWSGRETDAYPCLEIAAKGAVHDYLARFYRRFDSAWAPRAWSHAVAAGPNGYRVEIALPASELKTLGLALAPGTRWRLGLFRADFTSADPSAPPAWVTWVDAGTPEADFHVASAFGEMRLR